MILSQTDSSRLGRRPRVTVQEAIRSALGLFKRTAAFELGIGPRERRRLGAMQTSALRRLNPSEPDYLHSAPLPFEKPGEELADAVNLIAMTPMAERGEFHLQITEPRSAFMCRDMSGLDAG